jgi:hypothetical protein
MNIAGIEGEIYLVIVQRPFESRPDFLVTASQIAKSVGARNRCVSAAIQLGMPVGPVT